MPNVWMLQCYVTNLALHVEHCAKDSNQLLVAWTPGTVTPHPISKLEDFKLKRAYDPILSQLPNMVCNLGTRGACWGDANATDNVAGHLGGPVKGCESRKCYGFS